MKELTGQALPGNGRQLRGMFRLSGIPCGIITLLLFFSVHSLFVDAPACAQDDILKVVEKRQKALKEKEEALKKEEERVTALRREVEEKIEKYAILLTQLENALKKVEQVRDEKMGHVVKAYEAMPPEEAAARLSALDEGMAVRIMRMMKSKKAGTVMALMEPRKVASITREMAAHRMEK